MREQDVYFQFLVDILPLTDPDPNQESQNLMNPKHWGEQKKAKPPAGQCFIRLRFKEYSLEYISLH